MPSRARVTSILFAAVASFAGTAHAQVQPPLTCVSVNTGTTPVLRSEGFTEPMGDILLQCTGGTPTIRGSAITPQNITLRLNAQVTSRLLSNGLTEAALLIDEPSASNMVLCSNVTAGCTATAGAPNNPNLFTGSVQGNTVTFNGVPVDPPGTTAIRMFRFTNVRANAAEATGGASGSITPFISFSSGPTVTVPPIGAKPGLVYNLHAPGAATGTFPLIAPGVQQAFNVHMEEGFTNAWDQHLGHPIPILPGSGLDDGTRLGTTIFGPAGTQIFVPVNIQSPWVFLNLSSTFTGPFVPIAANGNIGGNPIYQTTTDPFGSGTENWFGSGPSNFDPVSAPQVRSFDTTIYATLSSSVAPGFQGYLIAVCNFQFAHGFAFISDTGAKNLAVGYLAAVLPVPIVGAAPGPRVSGQLENPVAGASNPIPILTSVNSASFNSHLAVASNALVSGFASTVGTSDAGAASTPLPTQLGGISVRMTDSAGKQTSLGLVHVNQQQVNYLLPAGLATGLSVIEVLNGNAVVSAGALEVIPVAPGLFSANSSGAGVAAGSALLVSGSTQTPANIATLQSGKSVAVPLDLTVSGQSIYLILYGTGFRGVSGTSGVSCQIGGVSVPVAFAGPQGGFLGLDQLNLGPVPTSLAGKGEVPITCVFDGAPANAVTVAFK